MNRRRGLYPAPPSAVISCRRINKSRGNYHLHPLAIILHLGRGDTAGQPPGRTLPGEIFAGVLLISSLTPGTRPFKEDPRLFLSSGHSLRLVWSPLYCSIQPLQRNVWRAAVWSAMLVAHSSNTAFVFRGKVVRWRSVVVVGAGDRGTHLPTARRGARKPQCLTRGGY